MLITSVSARSMACVSAGIITFEQMRLFVIAAYFPVIPAYSPVIPAKAGIYLSENEKLQNLQWIPAFAGMTGESGNSGFPPARE